MTLWRLPVLALMAFLGCASQQIDPHTPGERCLYSCPDGMTCLGTVVARGRALPGQCQLRSHRCQGDGDCRGSERCARPGAAIGVCTPRAGLLCRARAEGSEVVAQQA